MSSSRLLLRSALKQSPRLANPIRFPQQPTIASRLFTTSSPKMVVHNIETVSQFKETLAKNEIVIVDAFATWCGPCKAIAPQVAKWSESEEFKDKIYFAKFDVDTLPDLAQDLGIRAMPTFIIFKDGDKVDDFLGANPPALLNLIKKHAPAGGVEDTSPTDKPDAMKAAEEKKE